MSAVLSVTTMHQLTLRELAATLDGRWASAAPMHDEAPVHLGRVRIDSRQVRPGDVFWALPGKRRDGADFVADALARGATGVIAERCEAAVRDGRWVLIVDDSARALTRLAQWQRASFDGRVIAVTGSTGKTTTRQMIDTVLRAHFAGTASPNNYNNHLGVPLSMLRWETDDDYAVLELGASAKGEIAALCELAQPEIGVITNIGDAHLAGFGGQQGVAAAKAELLAALPESGLAILNGDDPRLRRVAGAASAKVWWCGRGGDCDLVATEIRSSQGRLSFTVEGQRFGVPVWGRHHLTSALSAIAVGQAWGLSNEEISAALCAFEPPPMRCQVNNIGGARWINDAYNASPTAMRAALELLREDPAPGRRIVVCGDMRELGLKTPDLHRQFGDEVVTVGGADVLVACGEHARDVVDGATAAGMPRRRIIACRSVAEAAPRLAQLVHDGDVVLVKGSRALGMERVLPQATTAALRRAA